MKVTNNFVLARNMLLCIQESAKITYMKLIQSSSSEVSSELALSWCKALALDS
jgi:hypothetical protein